VAAATILAALIPAAASADIITDTIQVNRSGPAFVENVEVLPPLFDPSLGTLTGATLTLAGTYTPAFDWGIISEPPGAPLSVPVTLTGHIGVLPKQNVALPSEDLQAVYHLPGFDTYGAQGTPEPFSVSGIVTDPSYFNPGQIDISAYTTAVPTHIAGAPELADFGALSSTLTISYEYTPLAPVPEPATFALLGAGLAGLCGTRFRRRSA
jgi:hypothetical protein